ncbi:hypothetical protein [Mameliella sediminis]|uniref:hypothetical protein n=1 Tax=Mameliella sediminis TaxID=2836866 RepID=UPI001C4674F7|nr:hypothetical protein [Mameliella sediminis]MBV7392986.1 hypothetical protein [Mameliella sediminis]
MRSPDPARLHGFVALCLALWVALSNPLAARDFDSEIADIKNRITLAEREMRDRSFEQKEIERFQAAAWSTWIAPWNRNTDAIAAKRRQIAQAIGSQDSRIMNDELRALLRARDRLQRLGGQTVDGCGSTCGDMSALIDFYNGNHHRWQKLKGQIAGLEIERERLYRTLERMKKDQAIDADTQKKILQAQLARKQQQREAFANLLAQSDKVLLPEIDGRGPPRLLTVEELIIEIGARYYADGGMDDLDSVAFENAIRAMVRDYLTRSGVLRDNLRDWVAILDADIGALRTQLGGANGATPVAGLPKNCPHRNPDPTRQQDKHRFPASDPDNHLACSYFPSNPANGEAGLIQSQVRIADGKEVGVAAYFSLDGGHHLAQIQTPRAPNESGAHCEYYSATAMRKAELWGHDGSGITLYCKADGIPARCDAYTHDGRSRGCRMDCSDKCGDMRARIGWPAMP